MLNNTVGLDFETWCEVSIKDVGLENYVTHPSFCVTTASAYDQSAGTRTFPFLEDSKTRKNDFHRAITLPNTICAHNGQFEERVLKHLFPSEEFNVVDTASMARAAGASSALASAAPQLLGSKKLDPEHSLMRQFSFGWLNPRPTKQLIYNGPKKLQDDWDKWNEYCGVDAKLAYEIADMMSEGGITSSVVSMDDSLTHLMNTTGWYVDMESVDQMIIISKKNKSKALADFQWKYDPFGKLNLSSLKQLKEWCAVRKIRATSFNEENVERLVGLLTRKIESGTATTGHQEVLEMLKTKQIIGGASLKKLPVIKALTDSNGRLRYQYMHAGAGQTQRTSGVGVQMQNLKRLDGELRDLNTLFTDPDSWTNEDLAGNLRQVFMAEHPQGQTIVGDFASVESRGLAFLAGAQWKLDAFFAGKDMYKVLAEKMFHTKYEDVSTEQRRGGKVGELSCGYGAGPAAVAEFAKKMHIEMSLDEAATLVRDWRSINVEVVNFWAFLDNFLHKAMKVGRIAQVTLANEMFMMSETKPSLPSIQEIHPGTVDVYLTVFSRSSEVYFTRVFRGMYERDGQLCYYRSSSSVNGPLWVKDMPDKKNPRKRKRYTIYGGKLAGILTQSLCREIFFNSMDRVSHEFSHVDNVKMVGQFHDEMVLEWSPPDCLSSRFKNQLSLEETTNSFKSLMSTTHLENFPLVTDVKMSHRYIK